MSAGYERAEVVQQSISRADADLTAAQLLSERDGGALAGIVCFHTQQATEKFIKAWLVHLGLEPPRTHSVVVLCSKCPEPIPLSPREQVEMSDYAVTARYPGEADPLSDDDMWTALRAAQRVGAFIRDRLGA